MRTLPLPLTALLVAAALVGCGDSDEPSADDAKAAYESVQTRLSNLGDSIGRQLQSAGGQSDEALERAFGELQARADAATEQLRGLDVPDDLADERDALRDAVDRGTDDLGDVVSAVRGADVDAAREAVEQLVADSEAISEARDAFERALDEATR
jgi:hypothetical protein